MMIDSECLAEEDLSFETYPAPFPWTWEGPSEVLKGEASPLSLKTKHGKG